MTAIASHRTTATVALPAAARRRALLEGARAMLPWLPGVVPFGLVVGVTIAGSAVDTRAGLATGVTIYSGSAQLAAIELVAAGAAPAVAIAAVLAINARLVLYSASMAPHWRGTSRRFRLLASALLVDPSYAVGRASYRERSGPSAHTHYLGAALTLWVAWQAALLTGCLAGAGVPAGLRLEYVVPLFLTAEVMQAARSRPAVVAAAVGASVAVVGGSLPLHSGPLVAIVAGITVATAVDRRTS